MEQMLVLTVYKIYYNVDNIVFTLCTEHECFIDIMNYFDKNNIINSKVSCHSYKSKSTNETFV